MKKVLIVVIDALASRVVLPAMERGDLPTLASLAAHGVLRPDCIAPFPSITPAATASVVTGVYPVDHHISGAYWFEEEAGHIDYYGDDIWVAIGKGMDEFFNDFMIRLNHEQLQAPSLYQIVERQGLTAAAVNFMWFRGDKTHSVNAPLLLRLFPGVNFASEVSGPTVLALADFAASTIPGGTEPLRAKGGAGRRFGFHDDTTAEYLIQLADADPYPDLTIAYFPNNDFSSHEVGPEAALENVINVDDHLGKTFEVMGGLDHVLQTMAVIVLGDHSQCDLIPDKSGRDINLAEILSDYQLAAAGHPWEEGDELMLCPNMRSCHIYVNQHLSAVRDRVIDRLIGDPRVDQLLWCSGPWDSDGGNSTVDPARLQFHVTTAEHGHLCFSRDSSGTHARGRDVYGTVWNWDGNLQCVDASVDGDRITYGRYPNALERIATGFSPGANELWVTARPGCEFSIEETSIHRGGSHGALNTDDSTVPLIVAGTPEGIVVPDNPRTIDVAPLALQILGLETQADELVRARAAGPPT